jgi:hypothetical protein
VTLQITEQNADDFACIQASNICQQRVRLDSLVDESGGGIEIKPPANEVSLKFILALALSFNYGLG